MKYFLLSFFSLACIQEGNIAKDHTFDKDGDGYGADVDCDDSNPDVYPEAPEQCDNIDNDCNEQIDENVQLRFYRDSDGDGFGDPSDSINACQAPVDYVDNDQDCDDGDANSNPDAMEICDERDNNCDGDIDEGVTNPFFADVDGDGFGNDDEIVYGCPEQEGLSDIGGDCDDENPTVSPSGTEICDGLDNNCSGDIDENVTNTYYADADHDGFGNIHSPFYSCSPLEGYVSNSDDCDDMDSMINPSQDEYCDGIDNDCDGDIDGTALDILTWYADYDGDGHGLTSDSVHACTQPLYFVDVPGDCDDTSSGVYPGADEYCDEVDNDCNGSIDDGNPIGVNTYYLDMDSDGYGNTLISQQACSAPPSYVSNGLDCNDSSSNIHPGATELSADGIDNDCDGYELCPVDGDNDGYGGSSTQLSSDLSCTASGVANMIGDCNDNDQNVHPAATESCNGIDDNCDGSIDDSSSNPNNWYEDLDGDGYGSGAVTLSCTAPSADYVSNNDDCDDNDPDIYPSAQEICNGYDDNCDGDIDDASAAPAYWYPDSDGDGYGSGIPIEDCEAPMGYVSNNGDCDPNNNSIHPGAAETCGGADMNCDGLVGYCASCDEILSTGNSTGNGYYTIETSNGQFSVECDMFTDGGGWTLILSDDFNSGASGYGIGTSNCGTSGTILGGYGVISNSEIYKDVTAMGIAHSQARILLDYFMIDTWDGEYGYVKLNSQNIWAKNWYTAHSSSNLCGDWWNDHKESINEVVNHSVDHINLTFGSLLDQGNLDESFGVDNLELWIR